jgi:hypothetical protein
MVACGLDQTRKPKVDALLDVLCKGQAAPALTIVLARAAAVVTPPERVVLPQFITESTDEERQQQKLVDLDEAARQAKMWAVQYIVLPITLYAGMLYPNAPAVYRNGKLSFIILANSVLLLLLLGVSWATRCNVKDAAREAHEYVVLAKKELKRSGNADVVLFNPKVPVLQRLDELWQRSVALLAKTDSKAWETVPDIKKLPIIAAPLLKLIPADSPLAVSLAKRVERQHIDDIARARFSHLLHSGAPPSAPLGTFVCACVCYLFSMFSTEVHSHESVRSHGLSTSLLRRRVRCQVPSACRELHGPGSDCGNYQRS